MKGLLKIELGIAEIPQVFMRRAMLDSVNFGCLTGVGVNAFIVML